MGPLRVGIVGTGHWGPNLVRNFHVNPRSQVTWLCDADPERLAAIERHYGNIPTTPRAEQVFNCPNTDAVVIATPTATHYTLTKQALLAGKHVLVEKPLTTEVQEANELVELAEKQGKKLMVGHVFLFNPGVRYLKRALAEEQLGKLHYLYFVRTNLGPVRADVNAWWDLGAHDVSILLYLLDAMPQTVSGRGACFINPPVEDVVFANLSFPRGVFANIHASWLDPRKVRQIVAVGSKKMLTLDDMNPAEPIKIYDKGIGGESSKIVVNDNIQLFRKSIFEGPSTTPPIVAGEPLKMECEAFLDLVQADVAQPCEGEFGADVVRIMAAVAASVREDGVPRRPTDPGLEPLLPQPAFPTEGRLPI